MALGVAALTTGCGGRQAGFAGEIDSGWLDGAAMESASDGPVRISDAAASDSRPDVSNTDALDGRGDDAPAGDGGGYPMTADASGPPLVDKGWRDTPSRLCVAEGPSVGDLRVWSDARGVFVRTTYASDGGNIDSIHFNSGSGWSEVAHNRENGGDGLTGFEGGPLIEYGRAPCGIQFVSEGQRTCSAAQLVGGVAVAGPGLAYAVSDNRVLTYDGSYWTQFGEPLIDPVPALRSPGTALAVAPEFLVVTTSTAVFFYRAGSSVAQRQVGVPATGYSAAWAFSEHDVWIGTEGGALVHWDGVGWSTPYRRSRICDGIVRLWGDAGVLYFASQVEVGSWQENRANSVLSFPCESGTRVTGLWGQSANQVFITVRGGASPCGGVRALYFDGFAVGPL